MGDFITAIQLIGFLFSFFCLIVGAYVMLRWGWAGVSLIWQRRVEFDKEVRHQAISTWMRGDSE